MPDETMQLEVFRYRPEQEELDIRGWEWRYLGSNGSTAGFGAASTGG